MKTQEQKLVFDKKSLVELSDSRLTSVKGGSDGNITVSNHTLSCFLCINSSNGGGTEYIQENFNQL